MAGKKYYGGDGPITLIFNTQEERDTFCQTNDYCNVDGKIREEHIYDDGGNHFGSFVEMRDGKFFDLKTGVEV